MDVFDLLIPESRGPLNVVQIGAHGWMPLQLVEAVERQLWLQPRRPGRARGGGHVKDKSNKDDREEGRRALGFT